MGINLKEFLVAWNCGLKKKLKLYSGCHEQIHFCYTTHTYKALYAKKYRASENCVRANTNYAELYFVTFCPQENGLFVS